MAKRYVVGDLHGNFKAFKQVLDKVKFDYESDELIVLGDICDGYPETKQIIDELLKIKNRVIVRGNHDQWFINFLERGEQPFLWINQGGWNTLKSYSTGLENEPTGSFSSEYEEDLTHIDVPNSHRELLMSSVFYYKFDGDLFVHGGFDYPKKISECSDEDLMWDRELLNRMKNGLNIPEYKRIFTGHTTTEREGSKPNIYSFNEDCAKFFNLDCGAGWKGRLCLLDLDTEEYFLSDYAQDLYPDN